MRIMIPVLEDRGKESRISSHFGRASYFALYNSGTDKLEIIKIEKTGSEGRSRLAEDLLKYNPDIVFVIEMGPRAVNIFEANGIRVETGNYETVGEILKNRDNLKKLEESCKEGRHGE